jgi:hypothetical protein
MTDDYEFGREHSWCVVFAFLWRYNGKARKISVRAAGVLARVSTKLLPNTSLQHYHYTKQPSYKKTIINHNEGGWPLD